MPAEVMKAVGSASQEVELHVCRHCFYKPWKSFGLMC